jgi:hypothetical protein
MTNPSDPSLINLGPFQLTVVNGLYLFHALRLAGTRHHGIAAAALDVARSRAGRFLLRLLKKSGRDGARVERGRPEFHVRLVVCG